MPGAVKSISVVLDTDTGDEAIYVDGKLRSQHAEVYAENLANAAEGAAFRLEVLKAISVPMQWPDFLFQIQRAG